MSRFKAEIVEARGGGAIVEVPARVVEELGGGGRIPVSASFDGIPYTGSIVRMGGITCLGVLKSIRSELGKGPGDSVEVEVERDDSERKVEVPAELEAELRLAPGARAAFDRLSYSHQREHVNHINEAKRAETRVRRAKRTVEALSE